MYSVDSVSRSHKWIRARRDFKKQAALSQGIKTPHRGTHNIRGRRLIRREMELMGIPIGAATTNGLPMNGYVGHVGQHKIRTRRMLKKGWTPQVVNPTLARFGSSRMRRGFVTAAGLAGIVGAGFLISKLL